MHNIRKNKGCARIPHKNGRVGIPGTWELGNSRVPMREESTGKNLLSIPNLRQYSVFPVDKPEFCAYNLERRGICGRSRRVRCGAGAFGLISICPTAPVLLPRRRIDGAELILTFEGEEIFMKKMK